LPLHHFQREGLASGRVEGVGGAEQEGQDNDVPRLYETIMQDWVTMSIVRRGTRSAITPPNSVKSQVGAPAAKLT
jgi:hypothetical protein